MNVIANPSAAYAHAATRGASVRGSAGGADRDHEHDHHRVGLAGLRFDVASAAQAECVAQLQRWLWRVGLLNLVHFANVANGVNQSSRKVLNVQTEPELDAAPEVSHG